jgi:hypothetical protein
MKEKLFKFMSMVTISLVITVNSIAQNDFTVTSSTDNSHDILKPIKAGASTTFQVSVKNNLSVYTLVSIDTFRMGADVAPWSKVDRRNDTIKSGQTKIFNVTLTVPTGTATAIYPFQLALNAVDKNGTNRDYNYLKLYFILDNGLPVVPIFSSS